MQTKNKPLLILLAVLALAGSFGLGVYVGGEMIPAVDKVTGLAGKEEAKPSEVDFSPFWEAWRVLDERFAAEANGTTTKLVSNQDKVWGAIEGLTHSLGDPYTVFLKPKQSAIFRSDISGNFEGVGMEIAIRDGILTVVAPLKGTPAEQAGILPADRILAIDGVSTEGLAVDDAVSLIRGPKGTSVRLTINRGDEGQLIEIDVVREVITIPTIKNEVVRATGQTGKVVGDIFVIRLYNFSANSLSLFRRSAIEFSRSQTNKMILDLRNNPGGFLEVAVEMGSFFLPEGKLIVKEISGRPGETREREYRSRGFQAFPNDLKLAILINQGSASASEILAGALRDHGLAKLIGRRTFGKGSVQELVDIEGGGSIKVTVARWLTPSGVSISKDGLEPDIEVDLTAEDVEAGRDPQFDKAVEYLLQP